MQTINIELFTINELSEQARNKAIEKERNNCDVDLQFTVEYVEEILTCLGFQSPKIAYSGFSSQGDGLSFVSEKWQYKKGMLDKVKQATSNKDVLEWAQCLYSESKDTFFKLSFCVERTSNRYLHSNTVTVANYQYGEYDLSDKRIEWINHIKNGLCRVFYRMLEKDYDYQLSDEYIIESLSSNDVLFLESGKVWSV